MLLFFKKKVKVHKFSIYNNNQVTQVHFVYMIRNSGYWLHVKEEMGRAMLEALKPNHSPTSRQQVQIREKLCYCLEKKS